MDIFVNPSIKLVANPTEHSVDTVTFEEVYHGWPTGKTFVYPNTMGATEIAAQYENTLTP